MGIYAISSSEEQAYVFAYDPDSGITPLYRAISGESAASWWYIDDNNALSSVSHGVPLSNAQYSKIVRSCSQVGGFTNLTVNAEGALNAELVIDDISIL